MPQPAGYNRDDRKHLLLHFGCDWLMACGHCRRLGFISSTWKSTGL
jgi:hypothetical protein